MQGLVNFSYQIGAILAVFLPSFCYILAIASFLGGAWGLWQQAQPQNPFRGKPWIPILGIVLSGVFSAFDRMLTLANKSAGTGINVGIGSSLTSYDDTPTASTLLGNTPGDAIINIVDLFAAFFQTFGAWSVLLAVLAWKASVEGKANRSRMGCLIQAIFGMVLINIHPTVAWIVSTLSLQT